MNPFLSFLVGPYGQAFALMDEYRFLPSRENFTEFTEDMYNAYFNKMGMPAERLYQMLPGKQYGGQEVLVISKTEMEEMLKAREFIESTLSSNPKMKGASDLEKLNYFKSQFTILFPNHKTQK